MLYFKDTFKNVISGLVLDFREGNTYWINIKDFLKFLEESNKKSINEKDLMNYDSVVINKKIMRINYKYDICEMLERIIKKEIQ